jgi:enediyne biosynthesis protein E4
LLYKNLLKTVPVALLLLQFLSCKQASPLFKKIDSNHSNIHFANSITEDADLNILNYEYLYNGGGVGIGDFNNDSLPDIYFTASRSGNKLYLNKGNMKFEDVTDAANVDGKNRWCKGVSVVDINNDGLQDIYISCAVLPIADGRKNILYINKGIDAKSKTPVFVDESENYGLADNGHTQMASFFDYDNDGDLDVFLLVNDLITGVYPNEFRPIRKDGSWPNTDKLYRNDFDSVAGHPVFTDVSRQAGILQEGYGLGINICDLNQDGWKDIYISNDYLSNNLLYVNNKNGTFSQQAAQWFKHTSKNAMGNDVGDINNDALPDIVELDMMPADNYRQKMMMSDITYQTFQNSARFDFMHQYVRNTLQINQGRAILEGDSLSHPIFSETGYYSGIAQTDWSWAPLLADADNDGYKDLLVSNGLPKDMSDLDFIAYRGQAVAKTSLEELLKQVPAVQVNNYVFKNNGNLTFTNQSDNWGWDFATFSAGMATADFDRDGDMDVVINNTNMEATLLENTAANKKDTASNYLQVQLQGPAQNKSGLGTIVQIFYGSNQQYHECTPYRGYMSSVENIAHFGLGKHTLVDSILTIWPDGKRQIITGVNANKRVQLRYTDATLAPQAQTLRNDTAWFSPVSNKTGLNLQAAEMDFIDFNVQKLLLHKLTQYGPALAAGDVNGDGLDDVIVGGGSPQSASLMLQQTNGTFGRQKIIDSSKKFKYQDDAGICLFDADGDGDLDLYIASGGSENGPGFEAYADNLYINNGKGKFKLLPGAVPANTIPKSCVKAADFDGDGDLDLFVGGRSLPGSYPLPVSSILLQNNSTATKLQFDDVTKTHAPQLLNIGMVCDAVWTDADNDEQPDLLLAGEWMPLLCFKNNKGKLSLAGTGLQTITGWWNSLAAADIDNDGDMDYVAGNFGTNSFLRASAQQPLKVYAKDFDGTGSTDAVFTYWNRASMADSSQREFPVASRDDLIKEMTAMKGKFTTYAQYAKTDIFGLFGTAQLVGTTQLSANHLTTGWIENKGNLQFVFHAFPAAAQLSAVYGICVQDFNGDGFADVAINGNEYGMAPYLGRCDALNGLILKGDGKGGFVPLPLQQAGFYLPGNGKALVSLACGNQLMLAGTQNDGPMQAFALQQPIQKIIRVAGDDVFAITTLKNGARQKIELPYGSSFFSQSARQIIVTAAMQKIEIVNNKKQRRVVPVL